MQRLFDQYACFEVALFAGRDVDDLTGPGIACGRFRLCIFDPEYTKPSNLDSVPLDQVFSHGLEQGIDNLIGQLFLDPESVGNLECEILFGCGHSFLPFVWPTSYAYNIEPNPGMTQDKNLLGATQISGSSGKSVIGGRIM